METQYSESHQGHWHSPASSNHYLSNTTSTSTALSLSAVYTPESDDNHKPQVGELEQSPSTSGTAVTPGCAWSKLSTTPKKRGRPRKHPIAQVKKATHARSRTGCATCRRRKKKCDERKPTCFACEKNNVFCDGYEPLATWKSGKEKSSFSPSQSPCSIPELPLLVGGIQGEIDQCFLQHFLNVICSTLFINDHRNSFQDAVVALSMSNEGLMHSILFLSSTCLLTQGQGQKDDAWYIRQAHHLSMSMQLLQKELGRVSSPGIPKTGDALILHALILCLQTIGAGDTSGAWRIHSRGLQQILIDNSWTYDDPQVRRLVEETFLHHKCCATMVNLVNPLDQDTLELLDSFKHRNPTPCAKASSLIGIHDGLLGFVPRIRVLRDHIRSRKQTHGQYWHDDHTFAQAFAIDTDLRVFQCIYPTNSLRYTAFLLYRQSIWLYLHRCIQPSKPSATFQRAVEEGLKYSVQLHDFGESSVQSIMLMPLFMLGCAAFDQSQRPHILESLERLESCGRTGNVKHARAVIQQIWQFMDAGDEARSWDWEAIMAERNWDFVVT